MEKYDIKKSHRELYAPRAKGFVLVDVPELQYIAVDGHGDPNTSSDYADAVEALFSVAYAVKFASRNDLGRDFVVGPLEGLWWADDMSTFRSRDKDEWDWTMLISQPDWISGDMVASAVEKVSAKKDVRALGLLRLVTLAEGLSVQALHIGSYDDETPLLDDLHDRYLPAHDLTFNGDHHEIYLSDARRTEPAKLRTVIRQPVAPR
ncbi:GyrI-like domain-containing protein [Herbiconiux sp. P15]|uniref:GyrI-like domain-containing protein n=1 Tax=Herbiconiux liukaitaii TaxID=3342799 RepID=UPI0035B9A469